MKPSHTNDINTYDKYEWRYNKYDIKKKKKRRKLVQLTSPDIL